MAEQNNQQDDDKNFFDDLGPGFDIDAALKRQEDFAEQAKKLDYLIHQTFSQNASGEELLKIWREALLMQATAEPGLDKIEIGIREGQKQFIRGIILTVERVEKGEI